MWENAAGPGQARQEGNSPSGAAIARELRHGKFRDFINNSALPREALLRSPFFSLELSR